MHKPVQDVYLVDDEEMITEVFESSLKEEFRVKCFGSAKAALASIESGEQPKVIVSDLRLPDIDGFSFIERLRKNNNKSKIIMASGYAEKQDAFRALDLGIFAFIEKPFHMDELMQVVARAANSYMEQNETLMMQQLVELNSYFTELNDEYFNRIVLIEDSAIRREIKFVDGMDEIKKYQAGIARERELMNKIARLKEHMKNTGPRKIATTS